MNMDDMKSKKLGAELKRVRESKGKTLEEIAGKTKINIAYLRSIENDEFDFLHTPYVLAFVKAFAKHLGLDTKEIAERFNDQMRSELKLTFQEESATVRDAEDDSYIESPKPASKIQTVDGFARDKKKPYIIISLVVILIALIIFLQKIFSPSEETVLTQPVTEQIITTSPEQETSRPAVIENEPLILSLAASDSIWFRVQVDDNPPREYIFAQGDSQSWTADERFELRTGKSTGINIYFNGERLTNLGSDNTLIWRLVLTAEGILERDLRLR